MNKKIRVGIVIGEDEYRYRLVQEINAKNDLEVTCLHKTIEVMVSAVAEETSPQADVVILEIDASDKSHLKAIENVLNKFPGLEIIILSPSDDSDIILNSINIGAHSFISDKTPLSEIIESIYTVAKGGAFMSPTATRNLIDHLSSRRKHEVFSKLTNRQMDIIKGISDGLSYKMIADKLEISIDTVRSHIKNIYKILDVHSKIEVVNIYRNNI